MKKIISAVLTLTMLLSVSVCFAEETISDWAQNTIATAKSVNIVTEDFGITDYTQDISREKFCELAVNVLESLGAELPVYVNENPFSDVSKQDVLVLNKIGVINGKGDGLFAPNDNLTREEAATILYRMASFLNIETPDKKEYVYYADENLISDWAENAVYAMRELGVMQGTADYEFSPGETFTIEQAVATVLRIYSDDYKAYSDKSLGKVVIWINDGYITDSDINYYISSIASDYANQNQLTIQELKSYNWDKKVNGVKLSDTIIQDAIDATILNLVFVQMGEENGVSINTADIREIKAEIEYLQNVYAPEDLKLRIQAMGLTGIEQYEQMYTNLIALQKIQQDMTYNPKNYYPEDISVLAKYKSDEYVTALHILVSDISTARSVLSQVKKGTDFIELMHKYNEDLGETDAGYTFQKGEMVEEFEKAAFKLNINEISDVVKTDYGYHIIKRVAGINELMEYRVAEANKAMTIDETVEFSVTTVMNNLIASLEAVK